MSHTKMRTAQKNQKSIASSRGAKRSVEPKQMNRLQGKLAPEGFFKSANEILTSPGQPLEPWLRLAMESRLGHNLSRMSIKSGDRIAPGFTVGLPADDHEKEASRTAEAITNGILRPVPENPRVFAPPAHPFEDVRIHAGKKAADSARTIKARAYTHGCHIVFGQGEYSPSTRDGEALLAHELVHVIQQGREENTPDIQRDEPPAPVAVAPVEVPFGRLPNGEIVSDPTGRTHGITIERRDEDLYYHLPPPVSRDVLVPRPLKMGGEKGERETVNTVKWGGDAPFQVAFQVIFSSDVAPPYTVNIFGEGALQTLVSVFLREPAPLEVRAEGLEYEREPGLLPQVRPGAARFEDARRYHMPGAVFSMYVFPSGRVEVVNDATGEVLGGPWSDLVDLQTSPSGEVRLTWSDPTGIKTVTFDLGGPLFTPTGLGGVPESDRRKELISNIKGLDITITEKGTRFTEIELEAAWDLLSRWKGPGSIVESLKRRDVPGLALMKDVLFNQASYNTETGQVKIPGGIEMSPPEQRNTIIHEVAHALVQAGGLLVSKEAVPEHVVTSATLLRLKAQAGQIAEGPVGITAKPRTQEEWQLALSTDIELNSIWRQLHGRFEIQDPEGTNDIRGMDVADESRYMGGRRGDVVGHAFDNVSEFIASFISSTLRFQSGMARTVELAKSALLADLYKKLWDRVNRNFISLGAENPYNRILAKLGEAQ